ncbi:MAG: DUF4838 domain-containing protein [Parafilimonas sp.]
MNNKATKNYLISAILISCFGFLNIANCYSQNISLVTNAVSAYKIVVSERNTHDYAAAKQLSNYINQISGAVIPVINDDASSRENEIVIGNNRHAAAFHLNEDKAGNTCIIKTKGNTLFLYGNNDDSSSADCVYYFAEKYLGCSVLSSDVIIIPQSKTIQLAAVNERYKPPFTYRDLYYKDTYDSTYTAFNRVNHFDAGGQNRKWGEIWSSSFNYVIPPKKYFKAHPDWFALNEKGERIPNQLNLTNEAMFNEYVKNFRRLMLRFPNSKVWSVAANDASVPNYCRCAQCEAINNREGTPMGTLLTFVNKIAAQFPDKIIATQAYKFYEEPPKTIKPASNVLIVECGSFMLNHAVPYQTATSQDAATYRRRLNQWLALTNNVRIWDYETDFVNLMCPFPNLEVQQKNLQYFTTLGIKDIFMQGNINIGGELPELRAYILAKLSWNPNANYNDVLNHFLNNYYGKAGPYIQQYVTLTTSSLLKSGIPLKCQDHPHKHFKGFLSPNLLLQYNQLFNKAENAVKDNPAQLERVKTARLSLIYAMLEATKMVNIINKKQNVNAAVGYPNNKSILDLLDYFVQMCKKHNIQKLSEGGVTVDSYQADFTKYVKANYNSAQ